MTKGDIGNIITFVSEDNEEVQFCVIEQTMLNGVNYLLVSEDSEDEEAEALILKEVSGQGVDETVYDIVEDEKELRSIADVFAELLEDIEIL